MLSEQGHEGEQAEQVGRRAGDDLARPLALRLHSQVVAHFAELDLDLPALDEPAQNLDGIAGLVVAEQGPRVELAERVTHRHPEDRDDRHPAMPTDGGAGADLDVAFAASIPARHHDTSLGLGRVGQPCCQE